MAVFIGRHVNKIDKKGRISVPKAFRTAFENQEFAGIYVYPSFKVPALEAADEHFIQRVVTSLDDLDLFSDEQDDLAATMLENTQGLLFDTEGRIMLPKDLMSHAGIATEAVFVGRGTRFQIWQPEAYQEHAEQAVRRARARGATLKLRPLTSGEDAE